MGYDRGQALAVTDQLQRVVDTLGRRLRRAVAIDDRHWHLLAYNSHHGDVDDVRRTSILTRKAPSRATAWAMSFGLEGAPGPVRLPPNPELQLEARVCAPIRCQGRLLGYLTLIDREQSLTDRDLEVVRAGAESAGAIIHTEALLGQIERGRERELFRDLLSDQEQVRGHAAEELVERNLLVPAPGVVAMVTRPLPAGDEPVGAATRAAMERALDRVRHLASPGHALHLMRPDHGILLVVASDPAVARPGPKRFGEHLRAELSGRLARAGDSRCVVGLGDVQRPADTNLSYQHALQAAKVATIVPSFGPVVSWLELGIYRTLMQFPLGELTREVLHPGFVRMLDAPRAPALSETLEVYLDGGCDVKAASARLRIHRATLYQRLRGLERVAAVDLRDGNDRLAMHLALKLARLAGLIPRPAG